MSGHDDDPIARISVRSAPGAPDAKPSPRDGTRSVRVRGPGDHVRHYLAVRAGADSVDGKPSWMLGVSPAAQLRRPRAPRADAIGGRSRYQLVTRTPGNREYPRLSPTPRIRLNSGNTGASHCLPCRRSWVRVPSAALLNTCKLAYPRSLDLLLPRVVSRS